MIRGAHSFLQKILPKFRGPAREIPRLTMAKSSKFHGLPWPFHLWLKPERREQKLQLLKAGIVLSYVSNIKGYHFFLFKSAIKLDSYDMSRLKWVTDEPVITHYANDRNNRNFSNSEEKGKKIRKHRIWKQTQVAEPCTQYSKSKTYEDKQVYFIPFEHL